MKEDKGATGKKEDGRNEANDDCGNADEEGGAPHRLQLGGIFFCKIRRLTVE